MRRAAGPGASARMVYGLIGWIALGSVGCASLGPGIWDDRVLRVGGAPNDPPVVFERDGEIVGIEPDLAELVGQSLDRSVRFERYTSEELLPALERGEIDVVMSGLSITPERSARVRFTDPYMQIGQLAVIRARDVARLGRPQALRRGGVRVGYERGTTGERFVTDQLAQATRFSFENVDAGIRSLRAGRIDFFVHDAPTIWRLAGDPANGDLLGLYQPLTEEDVAWAVRRDAATLAEQLDASLDHWQREGRIEAVLDRWIPVRVTVR